MAAAEAARGATAALDQAWANSHNCRVLAELLREAVACLDLHGAGEAEAGFCGRLVGWRRLSSLQETPLAGQQRSTVGLIRRQRRCRRAAGQQFSQLDAAKAAELAAHFKAAAGLVTGAGAEGWLLHMAFGAAGPETFSEAHAGIAEIVQASCLL